eukprot:295073-Chlamydomonas_euryale.AAC.9
MPAHYSGMPQHGSKNFRLASRAAQPWIELQPPIGAPGRVLTTRTLRGLDFVPPASMAMTAADAGTAHARRASPPRRGGRAQAALQARPPLPLLLLLLLANVAVLTFPEPLLPGAFARDAPEGYVPQDGDVAGSAWSVLTGVGLTDCLTLANITTLTGASGRAYDEERRVLSNFSEAWPTAIAYPASVAQVSAAVICAARHHVPVHPRCGNHANEGAEGEGRSSAGGHDSKGGGGDGQRAGEEGRKQCISPMIIPTT